MSDDEFKFSVKQAQLTPATCELQLAVSVQNEELGCIRASFSRSIAKHQLLQTLLPDYQEHPPTKCEPLEAQLPSLRLRHWRTAPVRTVERAADELRVALRSSAVVEPDGDSAYRQYRFSVDLGADAVASFSTRFSEAHELHATGAGTIFRGIKGAPVARSCAAAASRTVTSHQAQYPAPQTLR